MAAPGYEARLRLERSRAVKCPILLTHLATFKKVQQALAAPGTLARFLDPSEAERIEKTFAPVYPLDGRSKAGRRGRALACNPQTAVNYVLKPLLEGGGHNIYRADIPDFLEAEQEANWRAYVLMELINPMVQKNILLSPRGMYTAAAAAATTTVGAKNASVESTPSNKKPRRPAPSQPLGQLAGPTVSELGIFGVCLWRSKRKCEEQGNRCPHPEILAGTPAGWSLKTKPEAVDEMSMVKGYGYFDCLYLVDKQTYLANGTYRI